MARLQTVGDLIAALEELPEDMPIMAQHQPSWPLREYIGGIWTSGACSAFQPHAEDDDDEPEDECYRCGDSEEEHADEKIAYIILNGQPSQGSPYGDKRAWNEL